MSKKKQKNKVSRGEEKRSVTGANDVAVDKQILIDVIVEANQVIEEQRRKEEEKSTREQRAEWKKIIGEKEYPKEENWYMKNLHRTRNFVVIMWNFLFFKEKNIRDARITLALIQSATYGIFKMYEIFLYIVAIGLGGLVVWNKTNIVFALAIACIAFFFARAFRLASLEISKMEDAQMLFGVFSCSISFLALIIAIIALFVEL